MIGLMKLVATQCISARGSVRNLLLSTRLVLEAVQVACLR